VPPILGAAHDAEFHRTRLMGLHRAVDTAGLVSEPPAGEHSQGQV
jgi:hypothetical protein